MINFSSLRFSALAVTLPQQKTSFISTAQFSGTDTFVKSGVRFGNEWFAPNTEVEEPAVKEPTDVANGTNTTEETAPSETWLG